MSENQDPDQNTNSNVNESTRIVEEQPAPNSTVIIETESEAVLMKNQQEAGNVWRYAGKHPLFLHKGDELLGRLINLITPILNSTSTMDKAGLEKELEGFKDMIFGSIFGKKKIGELKKEFKKLGLNNKTACGELISASAICFRCLDCDMPYNNSGQTPIICIRCFDKSNHEGHRLVVVKLNDDNTGYCDCGDAEMIKSESFCPDHQRSEVNRKEEFEKFPKDLIQRCRNVLNKALYGAMSIFEIADAIEGGPERKSLIIFGQKFNDVILTFIEDSFTEINNSLLMIFNSVFEYQFEPPYNQFWHDCDVLEPRAATPTQDLDGHPCKCTIVGVFLRYCTFIETTEQPKIKKVLAESIKEGEFNGFLAVELAKYARFLFPKTYMPSLPLERNPILFTLNFQFSGNEASVLKIVQSEYFSNYINIYQSTVNNYSSTSNEMLDACEYFEDLSTWFTNPSYKNSSHHLLTSINFPKYILETLSVFQKKFLYPEKLSIQTFDHEVQYNQMGNGLRIQKRISRSLENNLKYISACPTEQKIPLLQAFTRDWYSQYELVRASVSKEAVTFTPIMERMLCYMLKSYQYEVSQSGLEEFFKSFLPEVRVEDLAQSVIETILRNFGLIRFFSTVLQPDWQQLSMGYYIFGCIFFEVDVVITQMMTMLCRPENLFEVIVESFLSYDADLRNFCKNPIFLSADDNLQKKIIIMKDFMNFLIYLMNDELCLLNLNFRAEFQDKINQDPNVERVVEKAAVNLLLSEYWTDLAFVKENLQNCILIDNSKVNRIIPRVTVHNENDRKIRIKEEYEVELDPYLFYKMPLLQGDIINESAARIQKNPNVDVVAGKTYNNLQKHLGSIQKALYQSRLPEFLGTFITVLNKETFPLVASALKLILQNLQVAVEFGDNREISKKVEENYLKREFVEKLHGILQEEDLKDCKGCVQKIQDLLRKIQTQSGNSNIDITHISDESEAERKKKAAQEKMRKIKEEFARKQALFANKNKDSMLEEKTMTEESSSPEVRNGMTCQHCLSKIDEVNDTYGVPVYLTFTNNFYDVSKSKAEIFVQQDYGDFEKANWWPIISSCHHYYHKKCFYAAADSIQSSTDNLYFTSQYESYCVLCKTLCNHFVIVHQGTTVEAPLPPLEEQEEQISSKLDILLADLRLRLLTELRNYKPVRMKVIVQRLLEYFIESFYLKEKPQVLKKSFEFYLNFFKNFNQSEKSKFEGVSSVDLPILAIIFGKIAIKAGESKDASQKTALKEFLEFQLEPLINNHMAEILIQGMFCEGDPATLEILIKTQLLTVKEYIEIKMLQYCITEQKGQFSTLQDCSAWLRNNSKALLENIILKELLFPIQKIILAYHFNKCLLLKTEANITDLCIALCHPQETPEYLDELLKLAEIPYTIESLMEECIGNLDNESKSAYGIIESFLSLKDEFPYDAQRSRIIRFAPRNVELPQVYAEYNNTFYRSKCSLCKKYNKDMYMSICMICGDVICMGGCHGRNEDAPGNLNAHATKFHLGSCMYLDLFQLIWNIIDSPYNMEEPTKDIYIDTFGQPVQLSLEDERSLSEINFNDFTLSSKFMEELRNIIRNHEVGKELFRALLNRPLEQIVPEEGAL